MTHKENLIGWHGQNPFFFRSNDHTTIRELSGLPASMENLLNNFKRTIFGVGECLLQDVQLVDQEEKVGSARPFILSDMLSFIIEVIWEITLIVPMTLRSST